MMMLLKSLEKLSGPYAPLAGQHISFFLEQQEQTAEAMQDVITKGK